MLLIIWWVHEDGVLLICRHSFSWKGLQEGAKMLDIGIHKCHNSVALKLLGIR